MRLRKQYGPGRWRKLKGIAKVRLQSGKICHAEVPWYEAHGIGRKKMKIKHLLLSFLFDQTGRSRQGGAFMKLH